VVLQAERPVRYPRSVNTRCGAFLSSDTDLFVKQIWLSGGFVAMTLFSNFSDITRQGWPTYRSAHVLLASVNTRSNHCDICAYLGSLCRRVVIWVKYHCKSRSQNCQKRLLASSCLSVYPFMWNNSDPTRQIFLKFCIWVFLVNLSREFNTH